MVKLLEPPFTQPSAASAASVWCDFPEPARQLSRVVRLGDGDPSLLLLGLREFAGPPFRDLILALKLRPVLPITKASQDTGGRQP